MAGGIAGPLALAGGSLVSGLGSIIGGGKQSDATLQATRLQVQQQQAAQAQQLGIDQYVANKLTPFVDFGSNVIPAVQSLTGTVPNTNNAGVLTAPLTGITDASYTPFTPTVAGVESTPGYQVQQMIGQNTIGNQLAGQGLRLGGAFGTALSQFETGLNLGTWQNQLQAHLQQYAGTLSGIQQNQASKAQTFNQLMAMLGAGGSAATTLTGAGVNVGGQVLQQGNAIGATLGAGAVAQGNIGAASLTGTTGAVSQAAQLYALSQMGIFGNNPTAGAPAGTVDSGLAYMQNPNLMVGQTP